MSVNPNELIEQFAQEARDLLETIGERLMAIERAPQDQELLNDLFRQVHTFKGNCGLFEFQALERVVHAAEDVLDRVRSQKLNYSTELADAILDAMDYAGSLVDVIAATGALGAQDGAGGQQHVDALRAFLVQPTEADEASVAAATVADVVAAPPLPEWVTDAQAELGAGEGGPNATALTVVEYRPEEGCFFKGEDPWRMARAVPGLVWVDVAPVNRPAANAGWDCYVCALVFRILTTAPKAYVEEHFRFVPEQMTAWTLDDEAPMPGTSTAISEPAVLAGVSVPGQIVVSESSAVSAPLTAEDAQAHGVLTRRIMQLWADQLALLGRADLADGSLQAVRNTLAALHAGSTLCATGVPEADADLPHQRNELLQWAQAHAPQAAEPVAAAVPAQVAEAAVVAPKGSAQAPDAPATGAASAAAPAAGAEDNGHRVLKVSQEKIDRLMDLIGEMVVAKNALPYLAARAESVHENRELAREIKAQYAVINRIAEDMQHAIMQVRMLPVGTVFQRFGRLVRDISRKLGKEVRLVMSGEDTEADKTVIEALAEPLVHILRNSLDHGIELPGVRQMAGKGPQGTIEVGARQEGDRVFIEIRDDGAGIDVARVKAKAVERGLLTPERAEALSDQEAQYLIFAPGFSTAETVTDLSGRGVGMDVVRSTIERINGSVTLHSEATKGTCITLSLPLSMAVTNVMVIETGQRRFGVPMDMIVETVRVHGEDIHTFKQARTAVLRGRIVPLRAMNDLLAMGEPQQLNEDGEHAVLVVRSGGEAVGLIVDNFHGTCDIILKPLEGVLAGITGFAGTALMGDGSVLLVLNPKELV